MQSGWRGLPHVPAPARPGILFFPDAHPGGRKTAFAACLLLPLGALRESACCTQMGFLGLLGSMSLSRSLGIVSLSTVVLEKILANLQSLHYFMLALRNVQEQLMRKAPVLGVAFT